MLPISIIAEVSGQFDNNNKNTGRDILHSSYSKYAMC